MAVIVSNGDTNLSTVNGFYRAEAYNLGMNYRLGALSTQNIAVTFANAGDIKGVILAIIYQSEITPGAQTISVALQENVAGTWTTRQTSTAYTALQITNNSAKDIGTWIQNFPFAGYAVDTTAGKWRLQVVQSAGGWGQLLASDGTNPFYVAYCNNALSYTTGDCLICKDIVTIDQSCEFHGVLPTGDTTHGICGVICKSANPTVANVGNLKWQNPPSASYTMTLKGMFISGGSHSGIRIGSEASPIALAQKAIIVFDTPTAGDYSEFSPPDYDNPSYRGNRSSFIAYGAPAGRTTLAADALVGATSIVTTDPTGWSTGDEIFIGGQDVIGQGEIKLYPIASVVGTTINLTGAITTYKRIAGGAVRNGSRAGIFFHDSARKRHMTIAVPGPSNLIVQGVYAKETAFNSQYAHHFSKDEDATNRSKWLVKDTISYTELKSSFWQFMNMYIPPEGWDVINSSAIGNQYFSQYLNVSPGFSGRMYLDGYSEFSSQVYSKRKVVNLPNNVVKNCVMENVIVYGFEVNGSNIEFSGNRAFGCSVDGAFEFGSVVNTVNSGSNTYIKNTKGFNIGSLSVGASLNGDQFASNSVDIGNTGGAYFDVEFIGATTNPSYSTSNMLLASSGSKLRFSNYNASSGDDRVHTPYGSFQRCGAGLSDTTVRTAGSGKYSLRFAPNSGTNLLTFTQNVPTGNIQGKTMTVTCWVYINNSAYSAGTHTKPQLKVRYDNATDITATATATYGSWQQLAVSFTPATTYGQIVVTVQGATDATGTNAYFYLDDFNIAYPAGVQIDLGGLDQWANALPVTPSIATMPSLAGVWDEPKTAHTIPGTYGALFSDIPSAATIAAAVWDRLTSALTTAGSIGKLLVDRIDAAITTRMASFTYTAPDNASITEIKAKTDNLPASPAATGDIPSAASVASAVWASVIETGYSALQILRLMAAALAGKISGAATTTITIRDLNDTKDRIVATVDDDGNRSAVTKDAS